ncbi:MAG: replication-associated recombination protein A, partial [Acidobacteria bacterium]|nr:replication-associated recombination protein A [Acidobacteriota bacterium]
MPRRTNKNLFPEDEAPAPQLDAAFTPLAERMRPRTLEEFVGQHHLVGEGRVLRRLIEGRGALP